MDQIAYRNRNVTRSIGSDNTLDTDKLVYTLNYTIEILTRSGASRSHSYSLT